MELVKKSNTGLGMFILIGLVIGDIVYNTVRHPVKMFQHVVYNRSWY